jgi:PhnB protein
MQLNPYLFYNDNCEAAFKFYEKALGGKIEMMLRADEGPPDMKPPRSGEIDHARADVDW